MSPGSPDNRRIAQLLERVGAILDAQGANPFRARAYRAAADTVRTLERPAAELVSEGGVAALEELPHVGHVLARAIVEIIDTGRLGLLERLDGDACPEALFATIPGIGPELAHRIAETLHLETLEQLETAAHDGRLHSVPGLGPRRIEGIREVLASLLRYRRAAQRSDGRPSVPPPRIATLLELDEAYRRAADAGELRRIAPRRFNPEREAWLPIWHVERDGYHFTALFSNSALAHRLARTRDWVVLFYETPSGEGQCTVVTETRGPLTGRRVVRGRERECEAHYALVTGLAATAS